LFVKEIHHWNGGKVNFSLRTWDLCSLGESMKLRSLPGKAMHHILERGLCVPKSRLQTNGRGLEVVMEEIENQDVKEKKGLNLGRGSRENVQCLCSRCTGQPAYVKCKLGNFQHITTAPNESRDLGIFKLSAQSSASHHRSR
jgi:hypothetical protein